MKIWEDVTKIKAVGKEIFIIGTAHVSGNSIKTVEEILYTEKPNAVAVELCCKRYDSMINQKKWDETEITNVIKKGNIYLFLLQLFLVNFQRKVGEEVGIKPGAEMLKAIKIAKDEKIKLALVDRDINITLKRAFNRMSLREKGKLLIGAISSFFESEEINEEVIENLKKKDVLSELMNDLAKEVPSVKEVLIDERNAYIAHNIAGLKGKKIVVIVGAGHVEGIVETLKKLDKSKSKTKKDDLKKFEEVPRGSRFMKYVAYSLPLLFLGFLAYGFYTNGIGVSIEMFRIWFLIHGILAALGVIVATGHPATIVTAFLAGPFTAMNPTIAVGWISGLVELYARKPKVKDFKGIFKLNNVGDFWTNRITRIILVAVFANIGGTIATFLSFWYMAKLL